MSTPLNPVERSLVSLCEQWNAAVDSPEVRIVVWSVSAQGERLLHAFFEAQQHAGDARLEYQAPDLFVKLEPAFETGFGYSRALNEALAGHYGASAKDFAAQDIAHDWTVPAVADSAAGFVQLLNAFTQHHRTHFRNAAAVLVPSSVTAATAFDDWLRAAIKTGLGAQVRLVLVQTTADPRFSWLQKDHGRLVRVIESEVDMLGLARATAAQSPGSGPAVAYRQLLTDVFALVEKGTARETAARADTALNIATRENWPDQQVVLHSAVAGAHQKEGDHAGAIAAYRRARVCAEAVKPTDAKLSGTLVMQTWFGEAGVWIMARNFAAAARTYVSAAEAAEAIEHRFFAIEGYRMAAYCNVQERQDDAARALAVLAVRQGRLMAAAERPMSTLALALSDQLQLQDAKRAARLERLAGEYQQQIELAHRKAESRAAALGAAPQRAALDAIEKEMHAAFGQAFTLLGTEREKLIGGGDYYFRKVVAVGRELLHPRWAGPPEVAHPLDDEPATWETLTQQAELPPGGDLAAPPPSAAMSA